MLFAAALLRPVFCGFGCPDVRSVVFSAAAAVCLYALRALAGGDCKYLLVMGLYFSFDVYLEFFVVSFFLAAVPAVFALAGNRGRSAKIPFGIPAGLSALLCLGMEGVSAF